MRMCVRAAGRRVLVSGGVEFMQGCGCLCGYHSCVEDGWEKKKHDIEWTTYNATRWFNTELLTLFCFSGISCWNLTKFMLARRSRIFSSKHGIYLFRFAVSGYDSNVLLGINTLKPTLCGPRETSVLFHCIVSILWVSIISGCMKCSILYKGSGLRLIFVRVIRGRWR
jgi:hypothetical protein